MDEYPTGTVTFVFTDVVQSSRLWEEHHDAMQIAMAAHDEIMKDSIAANAGVLIKQTGDGAFAVFASAFDATAAAMSIQRALGNQSWGSISTLEVRIGVHTGEAELRGGDYFGSSVNRAARVMNIAEGGEVLLSLPTQEVVRDRLPAGLVLRDLGERDLRGLSRPEHVFELAAADEEADLVASEVMKSSSSDEDDEHARHAAWIAVLPFENMSGDPEQEYFADGISEDVITGLAGFRSLRVIARTSSFRYRGSEPSISKMAEELGVRFVLEGSVRKAGSRVRVTAQLIEAIGGHHVWADRYDADLVDIFDVQDQITRSIVVAVDPAIRVVESERVSRARPDSLDAWDHMQRGGRSSTGSKRMPTPKLVATSQPPPSWIRTTQRPTRAWPSPTGWTPGCSGLRSRPCRSVWRTRRRNRRSRSTIETRCPTMPWRWPVMRWAAWTPLFKRPSERSS